MNADALSFGIAPFPNDTYLFHALATGKIPFPKKINFTVTYLKELNRRVLAGQIDVCKISANVLPQILDEYVILRVGAALGHGCGPIVVSTQQVPLKKLNGKPLATPGPLTTAHLLLCLNGAHSGPYLPMPPEKILQTVSSGLAEAGLTIHEKRFAVEHFGLHLIQDLGSWWESTTGLPLPLGVTVMRRSLGRKLHLAVENAIRESLQHAQANPEASLRFIRQHAHTMDAEIIASLICSYINEFSSELGPEGEAAVKAIIMRTCANRGTSLTLDKALFPSDS